MPTGLRDLFPEVENEETLLKIEQLIHQREARRVADLVLAVRTVEAEFGLPAKEAIHRAFLKRAEEEGQRVAARAAGKGVQDFLAVVEPGWAVTHEMKRIVDTGQRVLYEFTKCMAAEEFKRLAATDIGAWSCEADAPCLRGFNPTLGFTRSRTLLDGDPCCDHEFTAP